MTQDQFASLVQRLDGYARREPRPYRIQVGLLAGLGYVFIFLMLGFLVALTAGTVYLLVTSHVNIALIKLAFFLVVGIALVLRSLWVTIPPPQEPELTRKMTPRLFAMLDEVADTLHAPRFHHVQITQDFNAGVLQVPKLGLLGWQVNYLEVGLPLMQAVTPEQFRAVIAHEMGHLSANHSRFSGWIYRVRQTWYRLMRNLDGSGHKAAFLFTAFFNWYAPYFAAYSFVLARADEYVADRCAAEVSSAKTAAEALIQTSLQGRFFATTFWPELIGEAVRQPTPPASPVTALIAAFKGSRHEDAEVWYEEALEAKTDLDDTHPSLSERLAALGFRLTPGGPLDLPKPPLPLPAPPLETAAEAYLGPAQGRFTLTLDADWKRRLDPHWEEVRQEAQKDRRTLDILEEKAAGETLSPEEAWERVSLTAKVHGIEHAEPLLAEIIETQPENAEANYALGQLLLKRNDGRGVAYVQKAVAMAPDATASGNELLYWFTRRQGRAQEAAQYRDRAKQAQQIERSARAEREEVGPKDKLLYHALDSERLSRLRAQIAGFEKVSKAYLVRKQVQFHPDKPLYVLGIVPKGLADPDLASWIGSDLNFPGETIMIILTGRGRKMEKPMAQLSTALIYRR